MSKDERTEVELDTDQQKVLENSQKWITEAAAGLGMAYLEYEETKMRYELATNNLASRASAVRQSEGQHHQVMAKFAELLELGPGEWVYDGAGKLVRKDIPNAKST